MKRKLNNLDIRETWKRDRQKTQKYFYVKSHENFNTDENWIYPQKIHTEMAGIKKNSKHTSIVDSDKDDKV